MAEDEAGFMLLWANHKAIVKSNPEIARGSEEYLDRLG
jgi:hypothetical protein